MAFPANELVAKILRLQPQRDNLIYILENVELSDEQTRVGNRLLAVHDELVQLTDGIAVH
jgi:hypothetical protein